ncbi:hypothetical protein E2C01_026601 [Portunus trituberculatus]|uniref:Uncharacterized protein n=1 Tax=Portunus trituberculatus TaxID=210409 RepID=A0A5B7EJ15_PORTR|nr:hypothetical protein [Portunus trituberculatus]
MQNKHQESQKHGGNKLEVQKTWFRTDAMEAVWAQAKTLNEMEGHQEGIYNISSDHAGFCDSHVPPLILQALGFDVLH